MAVFRRLFLAVSGRGIGAAGVDDPAYGDG
jgi:hypothetical protein